jgi:hypothetical protein
MLNVVFLTDILSVVMLSVVVAPNGASTLSIITISIECKDAMLGVVS